MSNTEKPIIFNGEMIRAILDGRKTVTRRVIKLPKDHWWGDVPEMAKKHIPNVVKCPYSVGDILWVRESWGYLGAEANFRPGKPKTQFVHVIYHADGVRVNIPYADGDVIDKGQPKQNIKHTDECLYNKGIGDYVICDCYRNWWKRQQSKPSIHMPRWAARIFLKVKSIRVERIQDISEADAKSEGAEKQFRIDVATFIKDKKWDPTKASTHKIGFRNLWDSINKDRGYGWEENPYCWVYEFERVKP